MGLVEHKTIEWDESGGFNSVFLKARPGISTETSIRFWFADTFQNLRFAILDFILLLFAFKMKSWYSVFRHVEPDSSPSPTDQPR